MTPKQLTLATQVDAGFALRRKQTRRDVFLAEMDQCGAGGGAVHVDRAALSEGA